MYSDVFKCQQQMYLNALQCYLGVYHYNTRNKSGDLSKNQEEQVVLSCVCCEPAVCPPWWVGSDGLL